MNKPTARWRLVVDRVRYRLDNFFMRGPAAQLVVLAIIGMFAVAFGLLAYPLGLFSEANKDVAGIGKSLGGGFWDTLWWSVTHLFYSPISGEYGATWPVIMMSALVSLMGFVLVAALIGFISTALQSKLDALQNGTQAVREKDHLLILGWNDKIFSILDLFEDYHKTIKVVILSHHSVAEMKERMRTERANIGKVRPVLRTGSPTNLSELERVAFRDAYSIIVLADESENNPNEEVDIRTIKSLMLLAGNVPAKPPRPKMVAEIMRRENMDVARIAGRKGISLVCSSEILSRMIVQSSRQPGLSYVYSELFGFAGSEIYVQPHPKTAGKTFGEIMFEFPDAIPVGTSGMETRDGKPYFAQHMNPGKDYVVKPTEWLILLAPDAHITHAPRAIAERDTEFVASATRKFAREKILILGWNSNLFTILHEYDSFLQAGSEITIAALHPKETADEILQEKLGAPLTNATIRYVQVDYVIGAKLESLLQGGYATCILLADESSEERDPDARAILTLLLLQDFEERHPEKKFKQVVSEIISAANSELLRQNSKTDFIVSPRLISMLLAQVSQQLMLERVYADLMNAHANEIYLKPAARYAKNPGACSFTDLMRGAMKLGEIAIGVKIAAESKDAAKNFGIRVNPDKAAPLALTAEDEVIVISAGGRGPARAEKSASAIDRPLASQAA